MSAPWDVTTNGQRKKLKLAAVQMSPVWLNKQATTDKVCRFIREAGANGADVIGFPECIIPGYPAWDELLPMDRPPADQLFLQLFQNSVEVPGPETDAIAAACRDANIYAIVGVNERYPGTTGTTFNTQLLFGRDGALLNKHQKYVPTVCERLIHTPGQTGSAISAKTDFGTLSGLICGENANALAVYSASLEYPVVHVASWPSHFSPTLPMHQSILHSTQGVAYSLKCFLINSLAVIDDDAVEAYGMFDQATRDYIEAERKNPAGATIIAPSGDIIAGPLPPGDGILYAKVNPDDCILAKYCIDIAGHYNRPELFAHHFEKFFKNKN